MKPSILSTRKLSPGQRELLLNAGIGLVERDFISIEPLDFSVEELPANLIFTSRNSVELFDKKYPDSEFRNRNIFCVGEKTAALLKSKGYSVKETCHNQRTANNLGKASHKTPEHRREVYTYQLCCFANLSPRFRTAA